MKRLFILILSILSSNLLISQEESTKPMGWPREINVSDYIIMVYEPQNMEYVDLRLKSNSAVSVKRGEDGTPTFGMMWTTTILDVDRESKMASMASINVDEVRFPDEVSDEQKQAFADVIETEIPKWDFIIPLQTLIDSMKVVSTYQPELKNDPPKILFATEASVLILTDGEAKFKAADENYELIVNSSAFIAKEIKTNTYYLKGGKFWYTSKAANGPWKVTEKAPKKLQELADKSGLNDEESAPEEGKPSYEPTQAPKIIMAAEPSELIVTKGELNFSPLDKTNLLYVDNTESDLFMLIEDQQYYLLISGRWFQSASLDGEWSYIASEELPKTFLDISADGPKANVLVSVAGTDQARDAIYDAQIPQTAAVDRDTKASEVTYNGEPEFEKIKGLDLEYAVNTNSSVFKDGDLYFLCDNAIWFQSDSPKGPWKVAEERPEEVDDIPAENPQYNTKYVYIYETSPTVVYVGYLPGYYGCYVYGGTVVYGTGFYYNPWYMGHYYYHPYSYGFSMRYNSVTGWSFGFSFGSPYGWYGHSYWSVHYHWGPSFYRPPYYRYGYRRPVYAQPIYHGGRDGVNRYRRPGTTPGYGGRQPNTRPTNPSPGNRRPSTQPVDRPNSRPSTQPVDRSRPSTQPVDRANRPSTQPTDRASRPSTQPTDRSYSRPSTQPSNQQRSNYDYNRSSNTNRSSNYNRSSSGYSRPTTRTSSPSSRSTARPASRPTAMPRGGGGMRRR